jgi:hypothetical protein
MASLLDITVKTLDSKNHKFNIAEEVSYVLFWKSTKICKHNLLDFLGASKFYAILIQITFRKLLRTSRMKSKKWSTSHLAVRDSSTVAEFCRMRNSSKNTVCLQSPIQ